MSVYISLLRGINVGGSAKIAMADLRALYEDLGFHDVTTYVQSGNVVFSADEVDLPALARGIEQKMQAVWGFLVPVLMRTVDDFSRILTGNPFLSRPEVDPSKLHVTFLTAPAEESRLGGVASPNVDGDEFAICGQEIFVYCPNGYGRTRLNNNFFEKKLALPATTRNWNTVRELHRLAVELAAR
ncbi:MAG: DUF1697 domain-containing protein [Anaerolineaceae bacterium]